MNKKFSSTQQAIIDYFKEVKVTKKSCIYQVIDVSSRTIDRALRKYGYYTSYNYNASQYTLRDIPEFDANGLWNYGDIRFSKHNTLTQTLVSVVTQSESGYTHTELSCLLGVETKILLSRLCNRTQIAMCRIGRHAVYLSPDPAYNQVQQESRKNKRGLHIQHSQHRRCEDGMLPEGIDAITVITVLTRMIQKPQSSVASLSRTLQARNVKVRAEDIRSILSFYGLEKKTAQSKSPD